MAMGTANEFEELAMAPEFPDPGQALSEDERAAVEECARQIDLSTEPERRRKWRIFPRAHWKM